LRRDVGKLLDLDPAQRPTSIDGLFETPSGAARRPQSRLGVGLAAGLLIGVAVGAWWLEEREPPATPPPTRLSDVAAGIANRSESPALGIPSQQPSVDDSAPVTGHDSGHEANALFNDLRTALISARHESIGIDVEFSVSPNPVQDGGAYHLEILSNCDCQALVFFVDANADRIELIYPNPLEANLPLRSEEPLTIPTSDRLYTLEAISGTGIDRLKLFLLPEAIDFPSEGLALEADPDDMDALTQMLERGEVEFWSVTPETPDRLAELARLLSELESAEWVSAETVLHVLR